MTKKPTDILREARDSKHWGQQEMAEMLGISHRYYQKLEDGEFPKHKGEIVKKIDSLLGINLYAMIYEQDVRRETKEPGLEEPGELYGTAAELADIKAELRITNQKLQQLVDEQAEQRKVMAGMLQMTQELIHKIPNAGDRKGDPFTKTNSG